MSPATGAIGHFHGNRRRIAILTKVTASNAITELPGVLAGTATVQSMKELIVGSLEDDKGEDIVVIDLSGKSSIADYMVIVSGRSSRQVAAMSEHLKVRLKAAGYRDLVSEGEREGDWVLLDCGDVIVHLFRPEVREFYNLEKMWNQARPDSAQA
ncbi:ribosome silencing factor [Rhodovibrionaceae bacterium A322]